MAEKTATRAILDTWNLLKRWPGGRWLFNRFLRRYNPYSGSIGASISHIEPGFVTGELKDRHAIRNHLDSIHAIALSNFGELVSGIALLSCLPDGVRGIPTDIHARFFKKARGRLVAECRVTAPAVFHDIDFIVTADITDSDGDIVATIQVEWRLGRIQDRNTVHKK